MARSWVKWPKSRWIGWAVVLTTLAFTVYGSWLPFDFQRPPEWKGWRHAARLSTYWTGLGRIDFFSNLCLFVPVGFGGALCGRRPGRPGLATLLVVAILSAAVSVTAEAGQLFLPDRTTSTYDVIAHGCGLLIGLALGIVVGRPVAHWLDERDQSGSRLRRMLIIYLIGLVAYSVYPLDVTVHPNDLAAKWSSGRVRPVPFAGQDWSGDAVLELLFFAIQAVPLGVLTSLRADGRLRPWTEAVTWAAAIVIAIELAQLLVMSRFTDATQVIFGIAGACLGVWASRWLGPRETGRGIGSLTLAAIGWSGVSAVVLLYPFQERTDSEAVRAALVGLWDVPLRRFQEANPLSMSTLLARPVILFTPLGVLLGLAARRLGRRWPTFVAVIFGAGVVGLLEVLQAFVVGRVPDAGDLLVGVLSVAVGVFAVGRGRAS